MQFVSLISSWQLDPLLLASMKAWSENVLS